MFPFRWGNGRCRYGVCPLRVREGPWYGSAYTLGFYRMGRGLLGIFPWSPSRSPTFLVGRADLEGLVRGSGVGGGGCGGPVE